MEFVSFWINEEFYSVGIFAFIGVLVRSAIYIDFEPRDDPNATNSYGPFMQMFYTEPYLLPNLLGCFMMGLFYSYKNEMDKSSKGLYKGLTTGFCGSFTTFSSWMFTAFQTPFTGDNWFKILAMIVLESLLTWMCLILGMSSGKTIREYSVYFLYQPLNQSEAPNSRVSNDNVVENNTIEMKSISDAERMEMGTLYSTPEPTDHREERQQPEIQNTLCTEWLVWCLTFWILALPLWITLLQLSDLSYFDTIKRRDLFRAVCLAPLGAWLRWSLSHISLITQSFPTLYPHTMLANTVAVLFTSLLSLYSRSSWNFAINNGKGYPLRRNLSI